MGLPAHWLTCGCACSCSNESAHQHHLCRQALTSCSRGAQWSDLLTSIPTDPELISILEPLVMPPPPQAASHQAAAAQSQAAPAPQPADAHDTAAAQTQGAAVMRPAGGQPAQSLQTQPAAANRACTPLEGAPAAATRPPGSSAAAAAAHGTLPPPGAAASIGGNSRQAAAAFEGPQQSLANAAESLTAAAPRAAERVSASQYASGPAVSHSTAPQHSASASQPAQTGVQLAGDTAVVAEATQPPGSRSATALDDAGTTAPDLQSAPGTVAPLQEAVEAAAADDEIMLDEQSMDSFLRELHAGQG